MLCIRISRSPKNAHKELCWLKQARAPESWPVPPRTFWYTPKLENHWGNNPGWKGLRFCGTCDLVQLQIGWAGLLWGGNISISDGSQVILMQRLHGPLWKARAWKAAPDGLMMASQSGGAAFLGTLSPVPWLPTVHMVPSDFLGTGKVKSSCYAAAFFGNLVIYLIWPSISKILSFGHLINTKVINEVFYILLFPVLSLRNPACTLHLQPIPFEMMTTCD